jgi:hypothetical protein
VNDGLTSDGLETRRWNGTKSAFADYGVAWREKPPFV